MDTPWARTTVKGRVSRMAVREQYSDFIVVGVSVHRRLIILPQISWASVGLPYSSLGCD